MANFKETANKFYLDREHKQLDRNKLTELRDRLKSTEQSELVSIEDHKEYLLLLNKLRSAIAETAALNGENFNKTLASLLSVGADGLYTNDLRFIFELIQNVDDCDYKDSSDCELDMHFDFNQGTITLTYNEVGFSPFNVFSITGIAEAAKNISPEKIEIGEKGIGFKSVFGVADKVLIQSGNFSFILHEENFTVPEISYDSFVGISGTKLVLYVKPEIIDGLDYISNLKNRGKACRKIYTKIVEKYCTSDALFNNNPILFLKQLTKIKLYVDGFDSLEFTASKGLERTTIGNDIYREEDVVISSIVSSREKNIKNQKNKIVCTRYTMPIVYSRDMCVSRYGEKTAFKQKKMVMQLVTPNPGDLHGITSGTLYSFLPTQVRTSVPISCHIPFKLDSSREYIHDQKENLWFKHSRDEFARMLSFVYLDLAQKVKNDILSYLPTQRNYFFKINNHNDKTKCLKNDCFFATKFLELPVFYTEENNYKNYNEIFCFSHTEPINDPIALCLLMDYKKELFIPSQLHNCNVSLYGIEIVKRIHFLLFGKALQQPYILKDVLKIIDSVDIKYMTLLEEIEKEIGEIKVPYETIVELSKYPKCFKAFNTISINRIKEHKSPIFKVEGITATNNIKYIVSHDEPIDSSILDDTVNNYLINQKYLYAKGALLEGQRYFIGKNVLVLSDNDTLNSFAVFTRDLGKNDYFSANMTMRAASLKLNDAENNLSVAEYMKLLREVRESIRSAFGKKQYESYIKVIRELSSDPKRFIRELLQNADDCKYADDVKPCFKLVVEGDLLKTECNENGFTKENARAITAIGESTKKQIYSGSFVIGEKGIGFKTVFAIADEVEIHSGEFNFSLSYSTPTIPKMISSNPYEKGTEMIFKLRNSALLTFTKEEVLSLCLCLRNLKDIDINGIRIQIEDTDKQRIVNINNEQYIFDIYTHEFKIANEALLKERSNGDKLIDENQKITYYLSKRDNTKLKYFLYEGLPTTIEIGVPLIIDAPFELTASRDDVLQNNWNACIRAELYKGYTYLLEEFAPKYRIKIMQYIRFIALQFGSQIKFALFKNTSDDWLNNFDVINRLRLCCIIPTYNKSYFTMPKDTTAYRYPDVIHSLLSLVDECSNSKCIIDDPDNKFDSVLKNLGCRDVAFSEVVRIICRYDETLVKNEKLLKLLYDYLDNNIKRGGFDANLRNAKIIPVKASNTLQRTQFVSYNSYKDKIFVDNSVTTSPLDYKVLDTSILPKNLLERILDIEIKVMDSLYKKSLYNKKIEDIIVSDKRAQQKYSELMFEMINNNGQFKEGVGVLLQYRNKIPFKMENGSFSTGNVFTVKTEYRGCFNSKILNSHIVSLEANQLAKLVGISDICNVLYDDLCISENLNEYDVMDFQLPYFNFGYQILNQCMFDGFISEELIEKCGLAGLKTNDYSEVFDESDFPNEPIKNLTSVRTFIGEKVKTVRKIVKVQVYRTVDKIQKPNGEETSIDSKEIREKTLKRYRPASNTDGCFCQMCRAVKGSEYIETNNIFLKPDYYWPQTRISLCLDCSKKFTMMRMNNDVMEKFYKKIEAADTTSTNAISIPIGDVDIRFTQTHLAELQEIIKSGKK